MRPYIEGPIGRNDNDTDNDNDNDKLYKTVTIFSN